MTRMDFERARRNMIDCQIRPNRVINPDVIAAMETTPRELFTPPSKRALAYLDQDLALGDGRWLIEPMVLARLVQALSPQRDEVALVVGSGAGYGAAILSQLTQTVFALETDADLSRAAAQAWPAAGCDNVVAVSGPLPDGAPAHAPFDVILVEGAVDGAPGALIAQIGSGGRMVCVEREPMTTAQVSGLAGGLGRAALYSNADGVTGRRFLFDAYTPALPGFEAPKEFAL